MKNAPAISRFNKLVVDISRLYEDARIAQVKFAWETGRRIVEEEQNGAIRAEYGANLIGRLSDELCQKYSQGFSVTNLKDMRRFYLSKKSRPAGLLTWTNQALLLRVKDAAVRKDIEKRAVKESLSKYQLRDLIREKTRPSALAATPTAGRIDPCVVVPPVKNLPPLKRSTDLVLHTYAKHATGDVDCGFRISYPATEAQRKKVTLTATPSYTYAALVEEVIDGDTLRVNVDVAFGVRLHDKLRLRGINCPEMTAPGGPEAKRFVEDRLPVGAVIIIKSRKVIQDTYGRFVMDVIYAKPDSTPDEIIKNGIYLNQELLDAGHAVRMEE